MRIGRINGEFVINPTNTELADSELDLVVSGTRDAIMMVEAGAKILPEDVMADAIMFGHRTLGAIVELQDKLREMVGKPKRMPFLEAGTDSVVDFLDAVEAKKTFVVFDVETTSRDVKLGDIVEIGAVKVKGGKITDRWSSLVKPASPIVGAQLHGITDKDVAKAPSAGDAVRTLLKWADGALLVGHNVGFDLSFLTAALADGTTFEQGSYLDTLSLARDAYPDQDVYKLGDLAKYFQLETQPTHRATTDAEATAEFLIRLGNELPARVEAFKKAVAESIRARANGWRLGCR